MMTSKLFLSVWGVSGLMTASYMWTTNGAGFALATGVIGGGLFGAVITFIWSKLEKRM